MKVGIVTYDEYNNIPYVKEYEALLQAHKIPYDIMLWDRTGTGNETSPGAEQSYLFHYKTRQSKVSKIYPFIKWRHFILKILKREQYDKLIVCTTIPGVLLGDYLRKHYAGRYLLDIRDYTYEAYHWFRKKAYRMISYADTEAISSPGFLEWLPPGLDAIQIHNISNVEEEYLQVPNLREKETINIGFVGGVRYFDVDKKLMSRLKESDIFTVTFVGKHHPGSDLVSFAKQEQITNVSFYPRYSNEEKPKIYESIDLIHGIYGADSPETRTLLPHKLYDCLLYKRPILVSAGTYVATVVEKYHLGLAVDVEDIWLEGTLKKFINEFDRNAFKLGASSLLDRVKKQQEDTLNRMESFLLDSKVDLN